MNAHRGSAVLSSATLKVQPAATGLTENHRLRLFSGSANVQLSQEVARYLGMDLGPMIRKRFADGEIYVQIQESIRGCDVYLIQPCCQPVNDHLMELLIMIDACRRASARPRSCEACSPPRRVGTGLPARRADHHTRGNEVRPADTRASPSRR